MTHRFDELGNMLGVFVANILLVPFVAAWLLFVYGIILLVFRNAFGVELPNPFPALQEMVGWHHG